MATASEVSVTLSPDLYERLSFEASELDVPLEWLVAALVADTIDTDALEPALC